MIRLFTRICAITLLLSACGKTKDPCNCETVTCATFTEDQTFAGEVSIGSFEIGENKTPYQPYIFRLDQNICVIGSDKFGPAAPEASTYGPLTEIQLAGTFVKSDVLETIGKKAIISGQFFGQFSQWHMTPVLLDVNTIQAVPK